MGEDCAQKTAAVSQDVKTPCESQEVQSGQSCEGKLTFFNGHILTFDNTKFVEILFSGDQLAVACANGVKTLRSGHDTALE